MDQSIRSNQFRRCAGFSFSDPAINFAETEVQERAHRAVTDCVESRLQPSFELNGIWKLKELDDINLPQYVKTHTNVLSFPEKVRLFEQLQTSVNRLRKYLSIADCLFFLSLSR